MLKQKLPILLMGAILIVAKSGFGQWGYPLDTTNCTPSKPDVRSDKPPTSIPHEDVNHPQTNSVDIVGDEIHLSLDTEMIDGKMVTVVNGDYDGCVFMNLVIDSSNVKITCKGKQYVFELPKMTEIPNENKPY